MPRLCGKVEYQTFLKSSNCLLKGVDDICSNTHCCHLYFVSHCTCSYLLAVTVSLFSSKERVYRRCRMRWCPSPALHLLRCVRSWPCARRGRSRLPLWIREIWAYVCVLVHSLYFNSLTDSDVVFDSIFEPVFLTVDYITRWFGTVSVWFDLFCVAFPLKL